MIKAFITYSNVFLLLLIWLECAFFFSWINLFGCSVLLYGWWLIGKFILRQKVLVKHPGAFIISIGFGIFYFYFPLIGTLLANRPLTYEFMLPFEVFVHQAIFVSVYVGAFVLYERSGFRPFRLRKILLRLNVFTPPSNGTLWIMGLMGVGIFLYTRLIVGLSQLHYTEVSPFIRFLLPMKKFVYAPLLIPFRHLFDPYNSKFKRNGYNWIVYFYMFGLIVMSFLSNGRQFMISSILVFCLLFILDSFLKNKSFKETLPPKKIFAGIFLVFLVLGPLARIGNAMLMVRSERGNLSAIELFEATIASYGSKELDERTEMKENLYGASVSWDEDYTGNIFFDRLANLRIADMTLYYIQQAKLEKSLAFEVLGNQLTAQLPQPILSFLGISLDKYSELVTYTASSLAKNEVYESGDGGKAVAAHTGTGLWLFGFWYPLFFIGIYYIIFFLLDTLILPSKIGTIYSALFLINIYFFFTRMNFKNGVFSDILFMGRAFVELILLYVVVFHLSRFLNFLRINN